VDEAVERAPVARRVETPDAARRLVAEEREDALRAHEDAIDPPIREDGRDQPHDLDVLGTGGPVQECERIRLQMLAAVIAPEDPLEVIAERAGTVNGGAPGVAMPRSAGRRESRLGGCRFGFFCLRLERDLSILRASGF
jgi:hypothetical protein